MQAGHPKNTGRRKMPERSEDAVESLNDMFFTAAKQETLSYDQILEDVQKYSTSRHADKLTTEGNQEEARKLLREFICQYILSCSYHMEGMTTEELCDTLYEDMAGISFLKKWIYRPGVEEVNVNAYDDIEVIMSGGRSMKIPDRFQSPQHAIDVTRRLLNTCGMVIDDTMPSVIGFLDKNIRISVDKTPIVDAEVGINASIRIVNRQTVSREKFTASGSATDEMLDLLTCCIRYGVSVCIAGSTGSGKTTIMSWLLSMVPDNRRLITIEEGSRKIMQIIEGEDFRDGQFLYRPLYQYDVTDNCTGADGNITVVGKHLKLGGISDTLKRRMLDNGIPARKLAPFLTKPAARKKTEGDSHEKIISPARPYCGAGRNCSFYCFQKEKEIQKICVYSIR